MVNDNITRDTELSDDLIEYEEGCSLPIGFNCRHVFEPISKVFDDHDNVLMPASRSWVAIDEVHPSLGEGIDGNDWMKRGWMRENFSSEHLVGVTLINCFNTIFKDRRPEIIGLQDFLSCRKLR